MFSSSTSIVKLLLLLFLVISGVFYAKPFLMPFCIGSILATLFLPLCKLLERNRLSKGLSVFLCFLSMMSIITCFVGLISWQVGELTNDVELIKQKANESIFFIQEKIFNLFGITSLKQDEIFKAEQPSYTNLIQIMAGSVVYIFTNTILVLAYSIFLLYYREHIKKFIIKITPSTRQNEMEDMLESSANVSQQYLLGLSKMIVCLWIMYSIGFGFLGVKNFLFFAILCGILEIIPFVGNIAGTTLTFLFAALHGAEPIMLIGIIITYGIVQFIQGWILEPLILGAQVKINPLFTIVALILGQLLWGIPGIILAIPITAILKIVCDNIESLKPYGFLIGEINYPKKEEKMFKPKNHTKL